MANKKLDYFNLFYSIGAVLILFGVVCNIMNFKYQSFFLVIGLSMEMFIFAITSIKFNKEIANSKQLNPDGENLVDKNIQIGPDTFINIQTGSDYFDKSTISDKILSKHVVNPSNLQSITLDINNGQNVPNYVNQKIKSTEYTNTTIEVDHFRSLSELENIDFISINKDTFYNPNLDSLDNTSYENLTILLYKLFKKKLVDKNLIHFLNNYPVNIPLSDPTKLSIDNSPQIVTEQDINTLFDFFSLINYQNFTNNIIFSNVYNELLICNNSTNAIQVYGGERQDILDHIIQFHSEEFVISPKIEIIEQFLEIKNQNLINNLVSKLSLINSDELFSLTNIIINENEECKFKFLQQFNIITYNLSTGNSYHIIKSFIKVALSISNNSTLNQIISNNIFFELPTSEVININDIIHYKNDYLLLGSNNEYKIYLKDIFLNNELNYFKYLDSLFNKLVDDQICNHSALLDLFNLNKVDNIDDIFNKLNRSLSKRNATPYGSQLAFILLHKQTN